MRRGARVALALTLAYAGATPAATLVHAGRVIDGVSDTVRTNQTVIVENGKITAIEAGFRQPAAGDRLIDLRQGTLMPGWFDTHVHITGEYSRTSEIDSYKKNEGDAVIDGVVYAQRTLQAGFTHGAGPRRFVSLGDHAAQRDQRGQGARTAHRRRGQVHREHGRAGRDPTNGWARKFPANPGPEDGVINGVEDARKAVREDALQGLAPTPSRSPRRAVCCRSRRAA